MVKSPFFGTRYPILTKQMEETCDTQYGCTLQKEILLGPSRGRLGCCLIQMICCWRQIWQHYWLRCVKDLLLCQDIQLFGSSSVFGWVEFLEVHQARQWSVAATILFGFQQTYLFSDNASKRLRTSTVKVSSFQRLMWSLFQYITFAGSSVGFSEALRLRHVVHYYYYYYYLQTFIKRLYPRETCSNALFRNDSLQTGMSWACA